ncbi:hypothetical protein FAIPA1_610002 [Frankia sp. AiPs1]
MGSFCSRKVTSPPPFDCTRPTTFLSDLRSSAVLYLGDTSLSGHLTVATGSYGSQRGSQAPRLVEHGSRSSESPIMLTQKTTIHSGADLECACGTVDHHSTCEAVSYWNDRNFANHPTDQKTWRQEILQLGLPPR